LYNFFARKLLLITSWCFTQQRLNPAIYDKVLQTTRLNGFNPKLRNPKILARLPSAFQGWCALMWRTFLYVFVAKKTSTKNVILLHPTTA